jgi:hypothetical protein
LYIPSVNRAERRVERRSVMASSPEIGRPESGPGKAQPKPIPVSTAKTLGKTAIKGANKK